MMEFRTFPLDEIEVREDAESGAVVMEGHAAVYEVISPEYWGTFEKIVRGAFTEGLADDPDVRHLKNHNRDWVLGRTKAKPVPTLTLWEDARGLVFKNLLPKTSYATDLVESVKRGDIDQCSFAFGLRGDPEKAVTWAEHEKKPLRELRSLDLFDTSVVTYPYYPTTDVGLKSGIRGFPGELSEPLARMFGPIMLLESGAPITGELRDAVKKAIDHLRTAIATPDVHAADGRDAEAHAGILRKRAERIERVNRILHP